MVFQPITNRSPRLQEGIRPPPGPTAVGLMLQVLAAGRIQTRYCTTGTLRSGSKPTTPPSPLRTKIFSVSTFRSSRWASAFKIHFQKDQTFILRSAEQSSIILSYWIRQLDPLSSRFWVVLWVLHFKTHGDTWESNTWPQSFWTVLFTLIPSVQRTETPFLSFSVFSLDVSLQNSLSLNENLPSRPLTLRAVWSNTRMLSLSLVELLTLSSGFGTSKSTFPPEHQTLTFNPVFLLTEPDTVKCSFTLSFNLPANSKKLPSGLNPWPQNFSVCCQQTKLFSHFIPESCWGFLWGSNPQPPRCPLLSKTLIQRHDNPSRTLIFTLFLSDLYWTTSVYVYALNVSDLSLLLSLTQDWAPGPFISACERFKHHKREHATLGWYKFLISVSSSSAAEKVSSLGKDWHKFCLKCERCNKTLNPGGHAEVCFNLQSFMKCSSRICWHRNPTLLCRNMQRLRIAFVLL